MALFTPETAVEMGKRSAEARKQRKSEAEQPAVPIVDNDELAVRNRVLKQIERCDLLLTTCPASMFAQLTAAKERLWNLIYPKAGVLRPRQSRQSRPVPVATQVQPEPVAPQAPASSVPAPSVVQPSTDHSKPA